jgi:hypothetical protein
MFLGVYSHIHNTYYLSGELNIMPPADIKKTARDYFLEAQVTLGLSPVEMGRIIIGKKDGYLHYKKWIIDGVGVRNPSYAVVSHVTTLLSWHELSPDTLKKHIADKLKLLSIE